MPRVRRILSALMILLLLLSLAACGASEKTAGTETTGAADSSDATVPDTTEEAVDTSAAASSEKETEAPVEPSSESPTETDGQPSGPDSESPDPETTDTPASEDTEEPTEPEPPSEPTEPEPPVEETASLEFEDAAALREFLCGAWNYYPVEEDALDTPEVGGIPGLSVQLQPDGTFFAIRHANNAQYTGTWTLDWFFADEDGLPDWLCFRLDDGEGDIDAFGDFVIEGWASCTGSHRLDLMQVNNGDSIFSSFYEVWEAMLVKGSDLPVTESEEPLANASFCGRIWQVAEDGKALWMTEVNPRDFSEGIGSRVAVRYEIAPNAELVYPTSVYARGGIVAVVETDAKGRIVLLDWAEELTEGG